MAFEAIKAQITQLLETLADAPADTHEMEITLREKLNELKASGMPLPDDLVELDRRLQADFADDGEDPDRV